MARQSFCKRLYFGASLAAGMTASSVVFAQLPQSPPLPVQPYRPQSSAQALPPIVSAETYTSPAQQQAERLWQNNSAPGARTANRSGAEYLLSDPRTPSPYPITSVPMMGPIRRPASPSMPAGPAPQYPATPNPTADYALPAQPLAAPPRSAPTGFPPAQEPANRYERPIGHADANAAAETQGSPRSRYSHNDSAEQPVPSIPENIQQQIRAPEPVATTEPSRGGFEPSPPPQQAETQTRAAAPAEQPSGETPAQHDSSSKDAPDSEASRYAPGSTRNAELIRPRRLDSFSRQEESEPAETAPADTDPPSRFEQPTEPAPPSRYDVAVSSPVRPSRQMSSGPPRSGFSIDQIPGANVETVPSPRPPANEPPAQSQPPLVASRPQIDRPAPPPEERAPLPESSEQIAALKESRYGGLFEPAKVVARVGNQPILAGDLLGTINQILEPYKEKATEEQLDEHKKRLMEQLLQQSITTKLVYLEFLRTVPAEALPQVERRLNEEFTKRQLPKLMEKAEVKTPQELDAKLREFGSSVDKQRRSFREQALSAQMMKRHVNDDPEITHEKMLKWYHEHEEDYRIEAKSRWEQLMARFDKYPSERAAFDAIAAMGNEVLGGAPLPAVAKRSSHGPTAYQGGQYDWTTKGSLKSDVLDEAIFSLPTGRLSEIIKDEKGFHILRVIERQEETMTPFEKAQVSIKEKLKKEMVQDEMAEYLDGLRAKTTVWTIFDEEKEKEQETGEQD